jgi:hypothetical protein
VLSEKVAPAAEMLSRYFVAVQRHFVAYCRCAEVVKVLRFLQPERELHMSLIRRDGGRVNLSVMLGVAASRSVGTLVINKRDSDSVSIF